MSDKVIFEWLGVDELYLMLVSVKDRLNVEAVIACKDNKYRVFHFVDHHSVHAGPIGIIERTGDIHNFHALTKSGHCKVLKNPIEISVKRTFFRIDASDISTIDEISVREKNGGVVALTSSEAAYTMSLRLLKNSEDNGGPY